MVSRLLPAAVREKYICFAASLLLDFFYFFFAIATPFLPLFSPPPHPYGVAARPLAVGNSVAIIWATEMES
jgi:hypothetical protein